MSLAIAFLPPLSCHRRLATPSPVVAMGGVSPKGGGTDRGRLGCRCKKAVDEYRLEKGIQAPLHLQAVPEPTGGPGEAAWWMVPCTAVAATA